MRDKIPVAFLVALIAIVPLAAIAAVAAGAFASSVVSLGEMLGAGLLCLGAVGTYMLKDADPSLKKTTALPSTGTNAVASAGIDLGHGAHGIPPGKMEVLISAPALTTAELADAATVEYSLFHDDDPAFGTETSLFGVLLTQTGAASAGAPAATKRVRLPTDCKRYIRAKGDPSASTDKSAKSFTVQLVF